MQPCLNEMDLQESQLYSVEEGEEALTSLGLWHLQLFLCTLRRFYNGVLPPSPSPGRRHNPIAALTPHANKITLITLFTLPRPLLSRTAAQNGALCKKCFAAVLIDQPWKVCDRSHSTICGTPGKLQCSATVGAVENQVQVENLIKPHMCRFFCLSTIEIVHNPNPTRYRHVRATVQAANNKFGMKVFV